MGPHSPFAVNKRGVQCVILQPPHDRMSCGAPYFGPTHTAGRLAFSDCTQFLYPRYFPSQANSRHGLRRRPFSLDPTACELVFCWILRPVSWSSAEFVLSDCTQFPYLRYFPSQAYPLIKG